MATEQEGRMAGFVYPALTAQKASGKTTLPWLHAPTQPHSSSASLAMTGRKVF